MWPAVGRGAPPEPAGGGNPQASTFPIAAGIWWTVSGIIASFAGGYVAGRLSGRPKESTAGLHGITAWAATTLVIFYLLTSTLGGLLGGVYNTVSGAPGGAAPPRAPPRRRRAPRDLLSWGPAPRRPSRRCLQPRERRHRRAWPYRGHRGPN